MLVSASVPRPPGSLLRALYAVSERSGSVISNVDPQQTLLTLLDPGHLEPDFVVKTRNYRAVGTVAKINLALSALPKFTAANGEALTGRIHIGPEIDYLERAFDHSKYGEFSIKPYLEATIPTIADPSLAPEGKRRTRGRGARA